MNRDLTEFEKLIGALIDKGNIDAALAAVLALVEATIGDPAATGSVLRSPVLDRLCSRIGRQSLEYLRAQSLLPPVAAQQADVIILATELHAVGGHSRVIEDIIRTRPESRHLILLSDFLACNYTMDLQRYVNLGVEVRRATSGNHADRLLWIQMQLSAHPDAQVLVFNHHADAGSIAALQPGLNREYVFCHHADHNLCLGATLANIRHVDFFDAFCHSCMEAGVNAEIWPLAVPDQGVRDQSIQSFRADGHLTTCTSAHEAKLLAPYPIRYWDVLPQILSVTQGTHIHIGHLPADTLAAIHGALRDAGVPQTRFQHIQWVENLGAALLANKVDLYIGSFPLGGGRAALEAMSLGVPVVTHRNHVFPMLGSAGLGPVGNWSWSHVEELLTILRECTPEALARQSRATRAHYLEWHSPEKFSSVVRGESSLRPHEVSRSSQDELGAYLLRSQIRNERFTYLFDLLAESAPKAQTSGPGADFSELLEQGTQLLDAGKLEQANQILLSALDARPGHAGTLFQLGRLAILAGMPDDALTIFEAACQSDESTLHQVLKLGESLIRDGRMAEGKLVLSISRSMVAQRRPAGTPQQGLAHIRALSEEEWAEVLAHSHKHPDYFGFKLPGFPDDNFQINTMGSANENAMREAFLFYRAVLPFVGRMRSLSERTLLDFGTGWGRFPRTFVKIFEPQNIWGIDVDPAMIEVCERSFSFGNFSQTDPFPPTRFEHGSFDLITAYSVFSHLSEEAAGKWMQEFSRILRPGGFVAFTTQGRGFIGQCAYFRQQRDLTHPWHICLAQSFVDSEQAYADYDAGRFLFSATGGGDSRPSSFYGEALIPPGYMFREWGHLFDVMCFVDDRAVMPQAFAVLRKK
ncbi:methyltransferase domain-containing protein [Viridibacterium curvum]|uniref:Methyltransferase domain-containing protein n=1 Tax=Viridibacterium curvum TaxID=1101404 RepID=A0ABP9R0S0_9RHOO